MLHFRGGTKFSFFLCPPNPLLRLRVFLGFMSLKKEGEKKVCVFPVSLSPRALQRIYKTTCVYKYTPTVRKPKEAVD